jgi:hypothetical protein
MSATGSGVLAVDANFNFQNHKGNDLLNSKKMALEVTFLPKLSRLQSTTTIGALSFVFLKF